jgi:hypothetical protein
MVGRHEGGQGHSGWAVWMWARRKWQQLRGRGSTGGLHHWSLDSGSGGSHQKVLNRGAHGDMFERAENGQRDKDSIRGTLLFIFAVQP